MMSGADETVVDILTQYGERLGVAFQLADDVLDIASDRHESGKTPGTDLREGIPTLPVLRLRERGRAARPRRRTSRCASCSTATSPTTPGTPRRCGRLRAHPALEQARRDTVRYAEEARAALAPLPECAAKAALVGAVRRGGAPGRLSPGRPSGADRSPPGRRGPYADLGGACGAYPDVSVTRHRHTAGVRGVGSAG